MNKFIDVDIVSSLHSIMQANTMHFQSDFEIDKSIIEEAASNLNADTEYLLFMSRPLGTRCVRESEVWNRESYDYAAWTYYHNNDKGNIIAYAVKIKRIDEGAVIGDLYELDYTKHVNWIYDNICPDEMHKRYTKLKAGDINKHINKLRKMRRQKIINGEMVSELFQAVRGHGENGISSRQESVQQEDWLPF